MTEENEIINTTNSCELSQVFSNFFSKAVEQLKIPSISNFMHNEINCSLKEALSYFENHPGIVNIKRKGFDTSFTFRETNSNEVFKFIKTLNINKACQNADIPTEIIKSNADLFASYIIRNLNYCLEKGEFPCVFKHADIAPVHKKKKTDKANYRLIIILPNISKIYKKIMYQHLYDHFDSILSPKQ